MTAKRLHEPNAGKIGELPSFWFQRFLRQLECFMVETGDALPANANGIDYAFAAMQAAKLTLRESGLNDKQILGLFASPHFSQGWQTRVPPRA